MHVSVTGLSHHETPISLRELFAFPREELGDALFRLPAELGAAAILSTCNRSELYIASEHRVGRDQAVSGFAAARAGAPPEGVTFYHYEGATAVRHLYRVAAGVDSLVVGESEILGQVREAFSAATAAGRSSAVLARLFHTALRTGRRARNETEIGSHGLSISAIAVALSRGALGNLHRKTVLVVGAGEAGQRAAAAIVQSGAGRLLVTTRTAGRAEEIARELNGLALPFHEMPSALAESDVVISATSAPDAVITAADVAAAMKSRPARELVIVDIAVPRDVEPTVRDLPGVHLYDIDDLEAVADKNLEARRREVDAVEAIIDGEVGRFQTWLSGHSVAPTIAALRRQAESTRLSELERTLKRLDHLSPADRARIEAMSKALVKRLLHSPVSRLRDGGQERHVDALRDLFDLEEDEAER
jgi:glutamyl-tRNA reductase